MNCTPVTSPTRFGNHPWFSERHRPLGRGFGLMAAYGSHSVWLLSQVIPLLLFTEHVCMSGTGDADASRRNQAAG